jgi:anti-anti-sigma factor
MSDLRRLEVSEVGDVTVVRFVDRKILDAANIQELGDELFALVESEERKTLLLNFTNVEFLSSAALNKLIILDKKVKAVSGKLKLSNLKTEIREVFAITRLDQLFDIKDDEADALARLEFVSGDRCRIRHGRSTSAYRMIRQLAASCSTNSSCSSSAPNGRSTMYMACISRLKKRSLMPLSMETMKTLTLRCTWSLKCPQQRF